MAKDGDRHFNPKAYDPVNPPEGIPPIPPDIMKAQDEAAMGRWLASQPLDVQNYYLWDTPGSTTIDATGRKKHTPGNPEALDALYKERARLFREDPTHPPPGVNQQGEGIPGNYLAAGAKGLSVQSGAQQQVQDVVDQVPTDIADYTINPTLDQGPGYDLADKVQYFGEAENLKDRLDLGAIEQGRTDTAGVDAQKEALTGYRDIYSQGGLTAIDRARIAQSQNIRGAEARGNEQAIRAQAEEQGRAGGRLSYLLGQQARQRQTNQRAMDDLQTEALAQARRERALSAQADIGGQVQTAQDVIDKFNTEDKRAVRDTGNEAEGQTWAEKNRREGANLNIHNTAAEKDYNSDTVRSAQNTDRTNAAEAYNKSGEGGARGLFRTRLGAAETAAGHGETGAALLTHNEDVADQINAGREEALVSGTLGLAQAGTDAVLGLATKKKSG